MEEADVTLETIRGLLLLEQQTSQKHEAHIQALEKTLIKMEGTLNQLLEQHLLMQKAIEKNGGLSKRVLDNSVELVGKSDMLSQLLQRVLDGLSHIGRQVKEAATTRPSPLQYGRTGQE